MASKTFINGGVDSNWNTAGNWSPVASVPAAGDDVFFDASSPNCTINVATNNLKSLDMTGYAATITMSANLNITGLTAATNIVKFAGTLTYSSGTLNINPASATAILNLTAAGKLSGVPLTIAGTAGGSVVLQDALNMGTATLTLTQGTLNTNTQIVTCGIFSSSNSNTRVLTMTNSTVNLGSTGTVWNCATVTNFTITPTGSTINITDTSASSKTFAGGGKIYNNLTMPTGSGGTIITGANSFYNTAYTTGGIITLAAGGQVTFPAATTTTINKLITLGTAGNVCTVISSSAGSAATLAFKTTDGYHAIWVSDRASIKDITATGYTPYAVGKLTTLVSGTTGVVATGVLSNGTGGGNWNTAASWRETAVPGATDDVIIQLGDTVTVDVDPTFGSSPTGNGYALRIQGQLTIGTLAAARTFAISGGIMCERDGELAGDANGYLCTIGINNGTTDCNYFLNMADGFKLTIGDGAPRTFTRTNTTADANSGQKNIVCTSVGDLATGDRLWFGSLLHNGTNELVTVDTIASNTITCLANLTATHTAGSSVHLISRRILIQPTNDSYKISSVRLKNTVPAGTCVNCSDIWFRKIGTGSTRGIFWDMTAGLMDNCVVGETVAYNMWLEYSPYVFTNWIFYNSTTNGFAQSGGGALGYEWQNCSFLNVSRPGFSQGNNILNTYTTCRFENTGNNGYVLGFATLQDVKTVGCTFKGNYTCWYISNGVQGCESINDIFESNNSSAFIWGVSGTYGAMKIKNPTMIGSTIGVGAPAYGCSVYMQQINGNADDNKWYQIYTRLFTSGAGLTDTTTRTAGVISMVLTPSTTTVDKFTRTWTIAANRKIAVVGYLRKNAAYGSATRPTAYLKTNNADIDTSATMTDVTDTWEAFVVSGTTTAATTFDVSFAGQSANASAYAYIADVNILIRKYGQVYASWNIPANGFITNVFSPEVITTNGFVTLTEAQAWAQTGIAYDGSTITLTENHTLLEVYQYFQAWGVQAANLGSTIPFDTLDGVNFTATCDFTVSNCNLTGGGTVDCGTNTFTLSGTGDYDGTYIDTAGRHVAVSLTDLTSGSRVQIYNVDSTTELFNAVVSATTKKHWLIYSADFSCRIRVMYVSGVTAKEWWTYTADVTNLGLSVVVSQVDNAVYNTNAIDGSTVTECSVSGTTIRIYVDDPDNTTSAQRIYNWYQYLLSTATGIADQDGAYISATDSTHYVFDDLMKIINQDLTNPLNITGANITPETGAATNIFDLTNGASIALNFERVEFATGMVTTTNAIIDENGKYSMII